MTRVGNRKRTNATQGSLRAVEIEVPRGANVVVRLALLLIGALAFLVRVFSVVRFESVIHEYDPYFNYRVALFTKEHGLREFLNWCERVVPVLVPLKSRCIH